MSGYVEPVSRKEGMSFGRRTHWYVDGKGQKIPGVTTILKKGLPKPALVGWGIRTVAEYAVDRWKELEEKPVSERLKELKGSPYADRDAAANRGQDVHRLAEQLVRGEQVDVPEELVGHVESYVRFLDDWEPKPLLAEATVYHLEYGWAGTLDLVAEVPDGRTLLMDLKTSRSGVFGEVAYQMAMYRWSSHYVDATGEPKPMIPVDDAVVVHVRADGYSVVPVRTDDSVLREARYIARVARAAEACKDYIGEELLAPALEVA